MTRIEDLIYKAQKGDESASEILVTENAGLIWSVAKRFMGRGVDLDDLYQLGCVGFLKAIEGFDLGYGTQFSTYAVPKITGEIRRFLRDDGTVKVSRSIKERAVIIKSAITQLVLTLDREPTITEISEYTGIPVEDIAVAQTATASVESISQQANEDGFSLENVLSDSKSEDAMVEKIALYQAIQLLSEREKSVVGMRYFHAMTQQQVSRVLGVSQVQISRIEKKAITRLRELLA